MPLPTLTKNKDTIRDFIVELLTDEQGISSETYELLWTLYNEDFPDIFDSGVIDALDNRFFIDTSEIPFQ